MDRSRTKAARVRTKKNKQSRMEKEFKKKSILILEDEILRYEEELEDQLLEEDELWLAKYAPDMLI